MTVDQRFEAGLYRKSVLAARRYFKGVHPAKSPEGKAFDVVRFEMYRAGWMIGYRAGRRSK